MPRSWELVGVTNCGKGQPGQGMHVGHGSSGARFRDVEVGVGNAMSDATPAARAGDRATRVVAMALDAGASQAEAVVIDGIQRADPLRQQRDPSERGRDRHRREPALRRWPARRRGFRQGHDEAALRRLAETAGNDRPAAA